jgi:predicted O-methyltransferase YrrM
MTIIKRVLSYITFLLKSHSTVGHGVHSPFVYRLVTEVLSRKSNSDLQIVENLRKELSKDCRKINILDFGTGKKHNSLFVKQILKRAASSPRKCRLLYSLVNDIKPVTILELGTSLGIGTTAMTIASPVSEVFTIEGSEEITAVAKEYFQNLRLKKIQFKIGTFDEWLPVLITHLKNPFLVYIDGNHRKGPAINYFDQVIEKAESNSCIVIDDIRWSSEMENAWKTICENPKSTLCIDLFDIGIVYYIENTQKTIYNVRYW